MFNRLIPEDLDCEILNNLILKDIKTLATTSKVHFKFFNLPSHLWVRQLMERKIKERLEKLSIEKKVELGVKDESIASYLLKYHLHDLGCFSKGKTKHYFNQMKACFFAADMDHSNSYINQTSGQLLMALAWAHESIKKYILEKHSNRLSESQLTELCNQSYLRYQT